MSFRATGCLALVLLSAAGCSSPSGTTETQVGLPPIPADTPPEREFHLVAEYTRKSDNQYVGYAQLERLRERATETTDERGRLAAEIELCHDLLRVGEIEEAIEVVSSGIARAESDDHLADRLPDLYRARAIASLRLAERKNCIEGHVCESCIFPLAGGAIHSFRDASLNAREDLLRYLANEPEDADAMRWVLNIVAMTLGEYPDGVADEHRIDVASFGAAQPMERFVDVAAELGVNAFNLSGGALVDDFNGDGFLDIVTSTSDPSGPLTVYLADGRGGFDDRSTSAGVADQLGGLNCTMADYDNDGDTDVLVLRGGWFCLEGMVRNSLLRNDGHGNFVDVTREAGLADPALPTQTAVWGDFNNDGHLDLYVGNESLVEEWSGGDFLCQLFMNNGDGTFTDVAAQAGVENSRFTKGVAAGDYDNDGDLDIYVSNHSVREDPEHGANRLYRNNGDGTFTDMAAELGVTEPARSSFATWFWDYDNDGWLDLFVAALGETLQDLVDDVRGNGHGPTPRLYRNDGQGGFEDVTQQVGLDHVYLAMGAGFGDLDNDGFLDIYLGTGTPEYQYLVPNRMLRNDGGERFMEVTAAGGFGHLQKGHGVVFADVDNDGDQDVYAQLGGAYPGDQYGNAMFLNPRAAGRYLYLSLVGTETNRYGVGARVSVICDTPSGLRAIHRAAGMVSSFGSLPRRLEIGLGDATEIVRLEVSWPGSGKRTLIDGVPLDEQIRVFEGADGYEVVPLTPVKFARPVETTVSAGL